MFAPADGGPPLRVPFAGYKGDYQAVPATTPTSQGYPWLARQTGVTGGGAAVHPIYAKQDAGASFTLAPVSFGPRQGADIPFVLVHLNNFARRIRVEVCVPGDSAAWARRSHRTTSRATRSRTRSPSRGRSRGRCRSTARFAAAAGGCDSPMASTSCG